nr:DNA topoisomerase 1-like [Onthophagus taurus]
MAGTEAVGDLLSRWSYVVHTPSEEPEPSELPSTVDMAAFSSELNTTPPNSTQVEESSDSESDSDSDTNNSGSDESESSSHSDSSNSDTSTSSQDSNSRPPSPEFSVTSTQANSLRLTISKACTSPTEKPKPSETKILSAKCRSLSSSSDSDSDSDKSDASPAVCNKETVPKRPQPVRKLRSRPPEPPPPPSNVKKVGVKKDLGTVNNKKENVAAKKVKGKGGNKVRIILIYFC